MEPTSLIALVLTLAATLSYLNFRFVGLPTTIGVMLIALGVSLLTLLFGKMDVMSMRPHAVELLSGIDFNKALMDGMLSFLLFAGALHVCSRDLARSKWTIGILATIGVVLSTVLIGSAAFVLLQWLGVPLPYTYCLLFGALISPTDPIAVMSTLKHAGIPKSLETKIAGESLFNDGVGVVIFVVLLGLVYEPQQLSGFALATLIAQEAGGGVLFGLMLGGLGIVLLKSVDHYPLEILLTLALVMGGYTLASALHTSGPIAVVVAGLIVGNHGRNYAMSAVTRARLDDFWELLDEILNIILFVLIGLEVLVLHFATTYLIAGLLVIPLILGARFVSVGLPISVLRAVTNWAYSEHVVKILVWGGLRGGISVALALTLPPGMARDIFLVMTYVVVIFSITVQGLSIARVAKKLSST